MSIALEVANFKFISLEKVGTKYYIEKKNNKWVKGYNIV